VDLNDVESSTILAWRHIVDLGEAALRGADKRQALRDWLDLLAASHPIDRCCSACLPPRTAFAVLICGVLPGTAFCSAAATLQGPAHAGENVRGEHGFAHSDPAHA
jgi:hypothetical protein